MENQIASLQAQARQSAAQGQQMLRSAQANQAKYQGAYTSDVAASKAANTNLQNYTTYMQNAGNPLNLYNQQISQSEQAQGFNPAVLAQATKNLTQSQNALQNLTNASQSSTGGYGLSGAQLGNYYASQSQPLQNQISAQNNAVGNLQQLYQNALTQGQQGATLGFQGEQQVSGNLQNVYQNALSQQNVAMQQMQFYSTLAQQQGGLNAQQAAGYASAVGTLKNAQAAIESAQAAMVQAQAAASVAPSTIALNQAQAKQTLASILNNSAKNQNIGLNLGVPSGGISLQGSGGGLQGGSIQLQ